MSIKEYTSTFTRGDRFEVLTHDARATCPISFDWFANGNSGSVYLTADDALDLYGRIGEALKARSLLPEPKPVEVIPPALKDAVKTLAEQRPNTFRRTQEGRRNEPLRDFFAVMIDLGLLPDGKPEGENPDDYASPHCPEGFTTAPHFLVEQDPVSPPEDLGLRFGLKLMHAAKAHNGLPWSADGVIPEVWVRAPKPLEEICDRVRAYPRWFLAKIAETL